MRKKLLYLRSMLAIILILLLILFFVRFFSQRQVDDVSPDIPCSKALLEKSDVLYIIPSFNNNNNNNNISGNKKWCSEILALNKTLALHGYHHTYNEFLETRDSQYLEDSISIFKQCFNQTPKQFKPPQLAISNNNKELINNHNMKLNTGFNQLTHRVYHCNDTGKFPNWLIDWI